MSLLFCHCCGAQRGLAAPRHAFAIHDTLRMADHRPLERQQGQYYEQSPQLMVHVGVYRNGGGLAGREHLCDECVRVGLKHLRDEIDKALGEPRSRVTALREAFGLKRAGTAR